MTTDEKKDILKSYRRIDSQIREAKEHLEEVAVLLRSPSLDGEPKGPTQKDLADLVIRIERARANYIRVANRKMDILERIDGAITDLSDENERDVLKLRYKYGLTFEQVAEKMDYCPRHVLRIHGAALNHIKLD